MNKEKIKTEIEQESEEFAKKCGEILNTALCVESYLDFFISNYFIQPQTYKTFLLEDSILLSLNFGNKVKIFKEICQKEKINKEKVNKIVESINFVKDIRNKVAHSERFIDKFEEGIKLQTRKSIKYKKDELKIDDSLIKNIEEKRLFAIQGIRDIFL